MPPKTKFPAWTIQEPEARFGIIINDAQIKGPQRVTVDGKDAVIIIAADEFDRLLATAHQSNLYELFSKSPLSDLDFDFDFEGIRSPVRDV